MWGTLEDAVRTATHAGALIVDRAVHVNLWGVAAGTILYLVAQAVRTRGWYTIIRAAYPSADGLRARDVTRAYLAGSGINAIVPARGGDLVKLAIVHRRIPGSSYATLAATFVPETLFETAFGTGLVVWALVRGFLPVPTSTGEFPSIDVSLLIEHPVLCLVGAGAIAALLWWLIRRMGGRLRRGLAILRTPRRFITGVASWQALARLIRLASLAAFMAAFALPVTLATVVLVMAAQGGGRIIPLAPASAGLRLAMLSYGFVEVTGEEVDIASITAFTVGVGAVLAVASVILAVVLLAREFGTLSPREAARRAREHMVPGPAERVPTG
jgi:Lysylphosphatidylglycerol synthase TM region